MSRFSTTPTIKFNRSKFPLNHVHKTTLNVGDLVPVYVNEVLPGDTFKMTASFVSRLTSSFIKVPLDNLYLDLNFFFVPSRLCWENWVNLMGENTTGYWTEQRVYEVPKAGKGAPTLYDLRGTLSDYLGISPRVARDTLYSQMPFRAFAKVWNDWWRNENTEAPVLLDGYLSNTTFNDLPWAPNNIFGKPPKVSKFHDYFTSALPQPQRGDPISLPLTAKAQVPVKTSSLENTEFNSLPLKWKTVSGTISEDVSLYLSPIGNSVNTFAGGEAGSSTVGAVFPSNLYADLGDINGATVNDVRYAFALQRILEADARYGTRYTEMIEGQFGVRNPDARLQRSEYLGGFRQPIQFQAVAQTSQGTEDSPQANLSAYSHSVGSGGFVKSFSEYGYLLGVACIRQKHTYSQGINRRFRRYTRFDFYNPALANIGEQPIYQSELYALSAPSTDSVFGYQEAWADYRYDPDRVSGLMRPDVSESLAVWNFADSYSNAPVLNQDFLKETPDFVDRTLSVPSTLAPNFIIDFAFSAMATRVMPLYSIPSLVDHVGNH